jgi:hypothetical protein
MNQELRNRRAIDLDELERQLRLSADTSDARNVPDPLAELARLVGNDDPFKDILGQPGAPRQQGRASDEALRALENEFAADLRPAYGDDPYAPQQAQDDHLDYGSQLQSYDPRPPVQGRAAVVPPRRGGLLRSRGFLVASSAMVLAFAGIFTVFGMRSEQRVASGDVPGIAAKPGQEKVRPADPGGIDVPNQNKQVFEPEIRRAAADTAKVVTTTEQPIDLAAAPLAATPRTVPAEGVAQLPVPTGPGSELAAVPPPSSTAPLAPAASNEPKRVRSIAITVNDAGTETTATAPAAPAASSVPSGITAMLGANDVAPAIAAPMPAKPASAASATVALPPSAPSRAAVAPAVASPEDPTPATVSTPTHASPATPAKTTPKAAKQVPHAPLSLAPPPKVAARSAAPKAAPTQTASVRAEAPAARSSGGWAVQLGWRSTAALAQQAAQSFNARYGNVLGGAAPHVVQGESGGKQIYRIRVSAGERSNATGLCERIKTAGGSCFVARN